MAKITRKEGDLLVLFQEIVEAAIPGNSTTDEVKAKALSVGSILFLVGVRFQRDYPQLAQEWQDAIERFFSEGDMTPETLEVIIRNTTGIMSHA